jgi:hypothetical protein
MSPRGTPAAWDGAVRMPAVPPPPEHAARGPAPAGTAVPGPGVDPEALEGLPDRPGARVAARFLVRD